MIGKQIEVRRLVRVLTRIGELKFDEALSRSESTADTVSQTVEAGARPVAEPTTKYRVEEYKMTDINKILSVIKTINSHCKEIDALEETIKKEYNTEYSYISNTTSGMIEDMKSKYTSFINNNFRSIQNAVDNLVGILQEDYSDEVAKTTEAPAAEFERVSFEENKQQLASIIATINEYVAHLNKTNFNELVPPVTVDVQSEVFTTSVGGRPTGKQYDHTTQPIREIRDPKPVRTIVRNMLPYCARAMKCVEVMISKYNSSFNLPAFSSYVQSNAASWMAELKAKMHGRYSARFDELFLNEKGEAIPKEFFSTLRAQGEEFNVDIAAGTDTYKQAITIGDVKLLVEDDKKHLSYISESPVLSKNLESGFLASPLILDLKKQGNILLNVKEDNYSEETINFVNQLIIQFLVSFPANRINFCLLDIDNKMGFSQFKSLTKINNNILFNGIIRDDRQLDNTIKDMEQTMYKIDDDILSYNNVEDIYEYNERFEANPQSVHLFVLVNYPSGMKDDIAKRVLKIIQNGNKAGIFSIIINNATCALNPNYKPQDHQQFIESVGRNSLIINKSGSTFSLNLPVRNRFVPSKGISTSSLASIIELLKGNAEAGRQKVIPLSQMFQESDALAKSPKGIPSSAEVLDIPIGARGGEIQNLLLKTTGDGSAHAVVIGGTGSGKSNLLHTIIMSACYKYSPEELNLYLVDFKGGVEFKFYEANKVRERQMPHIKLTGLTSDLDDGVAILNNLHKELRRREDEFRRCRVEDIVQYRALGNKMPRLFVIIDEIQELFEQDDRLGQKAIDILRELFKKGRAFGINILWASQNIPNAPGLKDKVLSQIGNRISLRLNEPDDALDIKIDPKVVRNLNRPEKGLGVINDIRYGNESIEFRVAYAETSENRQRFSEEIINKWKGVTSASSEPLFIVGDDDESSPMDGNTVYTRVPTKDSIVSKAFESYVVQLGQDYVTGKPFDITLPLRENKMNLLMAGYDAEILRDMVGYSLLSVLMEHMTNADCLDKASKIYCANGEMINPKNSGDLFNVVRSDFDKVIENASSTEKMIACIKDTYKTYKERAIESDSSDYAIPYTPIFIVIHSMQRYADLFTENPMLKLNEETASAPTAFAPETSKLDQAMSLFSSVQTPSAPVAPKNSKMPDTVFFSDAVKEMLDRGGKFGIHFIITIDNPLGIAPIKNDMSEIMYKVFVKGINTTVVSQMLGDYKISNSLSNPKVALVAMQDERMKVRVYRYESAQDEAWYKKLRDSYNALGGN